MLPCGICCCAVLPARRQPSQAQLPSRGPREDSGLGGAPQRRLRHAHGRRDALQSRSSDAADAVQLQRVAVLHRQRLRPHPKLRPCPAPPPPPPPRATTPVKLQAILDIFGDCFYSRQKCPVAVLNTCAGCADSTIALKKVVTVGRATNSSPPTARAMERRRRPVSSPPFEAVVPCCGVDARRSAPRGPPRPAARSCSRRWGWSPPPPAAAAPPAAPAPRAASGSGSRCSTTSTTAAASTPASSPHPSAHAAPSREPRKRQ